MNFGLSVGISKCWNCEEFEKVFELVFEYDWKIVVEEGIVGREIEIGVFGNDELKCFVVGEIVLKIDFYDYKVKYEDGDMDLMIFV